MAIDSKGNLWVADTYNHRLQEFSSEGKLIKVVQPAEGKSGHMVNPSGFSTTGLFNGKVAHPDTIEVVEEGTV